MITKRVLCLLPVLLVGCASYEENFECPVGQGVRCASLSTINQKIDKGEIVLLDERPKDNGVTYGSDFPNGLWY